MIRTHDLSQELEPLHQLTQTIVIFRIHYIVNSHKLLLYLGFIILSFEYINFYSLYNIYFYLLNELPIIQTKTLTTFMNIWFGNSFGSFIQTKSIL